MKISVHVAQVQEEVVRYTEFVLHLAVISIVIIGVMRLSYNVGRGTL